METIEEITREQGQEDQQEFKRKQLVRTFGWISFGLAIIYFFNGLVGMFSSSTIDTFGSLAMLDDNMPHEYTDWMQTVSSLTFYQGLITFVVATVMIVGSIGYATLKEWGRTTYIGACFGAIAANVFSVFIAQRMMSGISSVMDAAPGNPGIDFGSAMGSMGLMFAILISLIPLTYLIINIVVANKPLTKKIMVG